MLVKPSTPPPEPLQPSRSTVLNTSQPVPPTPLVDLPQTSTTYNVPHIQLDADHISNAMAARLATSLLGHVLFLKSQIPFPVVQMSRMGTMKSKSTSKAAKKRIELMAAIDTLSSHLETTFLALSSAFAQREISGLGAAKDNYHYPRKEKAHMIFVVGPSVGAAKAKVALVFDGLEVKLAGQRDDTAQVWESVSEESAAAASDSSEEEDTESTASEGSVLDDSTSEGEAEDGRDSEQEEAPPPPASPSPSPSPSPAPSRPTTPLSLPIRTTKPSPLTIHSDPRSPPSSPSSSSSFPNPHPSLASKPTPHQNQNQKPSPLSTLSTPLLPVHGPHKSHLTPLPLPPSSHSSHSHASHQLQTADRLLSRTLATFCAEDERGGMNCELAPTQTHVLLRAPRWFVHPAWVPRLNLCKSLESALEAFVEGSTTAPTTVSKQKSRVGGKVEGVWVSCRESLVEAREEAGTSSWEEEGRSSREEVGKEEDGKEVNSGEGMDKEEEKAGKEQEKEGKEQDKEQEEEEKEEDEMIWWQWDGKIVGFSDW